VIANLFTADKRQLTIIAWSSVGPRVDSSACGSPIPKDLPTGPLVVCMYGCCSLSPRRSANWASATGNNASDPLGDRYRIRTNN